MLWLLRNISENRTFESASFRDYWFNKMENYPGYIDHASEETFGNIKTNRNSKAWGSGSTEISAAGRIAPLLLLCSDSPEKLKNAAAAQAAITHNSEIVITASSFFAELASKLLEGEEPVAALKSLGKKYGDPFSKWVEDGIKSSSRKTSLAIKRFGQACDTSQGFPGIIHLIIKYRRDYRRAMEENGWAGGDSAARGLLTGMLLGIVNGTDAVPEEWKRNLTAYSEISNLIEQLTENYNKKTILRFT